MSKAACAVGLRLGRHTPQSEASCPKVVRLKDLLVAVLAFSSFNNYTGAVIPHVGLLLLNEQSFIASVLRRKVHSLADHLGEIPVGGFGHLVFLHITPTTTCI